MEIYMIVGILFLQDQIESLNIAISIVRNFKRSIFIAACKIVARLTKRNRSTEKLR